MKDIVYETELMCAASIGYGSLRKTIFLLQAYRVLHHHAQGWCHYVICKTQRVILHLNIMP